MKLAEAGLIGPSTSISSTSWFEPGDEPWAGAKSIWRKTSAAVNITVTRSTRRRFSVGFTFLRRGPSGCAGWPSYTITESLAATPLRYARCQLARGYLSAGRREGESADL